MAKRSIFQIETPTERRKRLRVEHKRDMGALYAKYNFAPPVSPMKKRKLYGIIRGLTREYDVVTMQMIRDEAKGKRLGQLDHTLTALKVSGDVYSPKHGQFKTAKMR